MDRREQIAMHFETEILIEVAIEPELAGELRIAGFLAPVPALVGEAVGSLATPFVGGVVGFVISKIAEEKESTLFTRAIADLVASTRSDQEKYGSTCRSALAHAAIRSFDWAFGALQVAASVSDEWARHHHIYGLIHGACGDGQAAKAELAWALRAEPDGAARERIRRATELADLM